MNNFKREYEFQKRRLTRKMSRSSYTTAWFFTVAIVVLLFAFVLQIKENSENDRSQKQQSSLNRLNDFGSQKDEALSPEQIRVKLMLESMKAKVINQQELLAAPTSPSESSQDSGMLDSSSLSISQESSPISKESPRAIEASRSLPEPNVLYSLKEKQESEGMDSEGSDSSGLSKIEAMKANARSKGYLLEVDPKTLDVISVTNIKTGEPVDFSY